MIPSRQFMIQQAVLNAMAKHLPASLEIGGPAYVGRFILNQVDRLSVPGPVPLHWLQVIRAEFLLLAIRYGVKIQ